MLKKPNNCVDLVLILNFVFQSTFNMENYKDQLAHLKEMRNIMERSSRFFSLSGLSGILIGLYALVAAFIAYTLIYSDSNSDSFSQSIFRDDYIDYIVRIYNIDIYLMLIGGATLLISLLTVIFLSKRKANKTKESLWNASSKLLVWNLMLPLAVGGCFGLICIYKGWFGIVGPITLIFYGLALINASKYTFGDIQLLGCIECALGLISLLYIGYGLIFWAIGFGILHIVYGIRMWHKYDR